MRLKKWIAGVLAGSVMAFGLAGCGSKSEPADVHATGGKDNAQQEQKKDPVHLVVWSHLTEPEIAELQKLADQWAQETGNTVEVLPDQTGFQEFATAAASGQGPDIMYGLPHDNLGTFHKAGLLAEVPSGLINPSDYEQVSIDAVSFDGKMYAVPVSMEAIGLFYNKALVPEPPKTWDEFITVAKEKGFVYKVKDFYFSYGFIGGMGGYVFKNTGGALDPTDIGLANEGAIEGLQLIADLIHKYKLMPIDIDYDPAKAAFLNGEAALWLNGPWEVSGTKEAGIDFGIAPMPTLPNGKPFTPFVGVQTAFVSSSSEHQDVAWELIKYLNENGAIPLFKTGNRFPVLKSVKNSEEVKSNEIMAGFGASAANGVPMPNIPEMQAVWTPAASMLDLVVTGGASPADAARQAVSAIEEGIAGMN